MGPSPKGLKPFIDELQALFKPFFKLIRVKEIRVKDLSPDLSPFSKRAWA